MREIGVVALVACAFACSARQPMPVVETLSGGGETPELGPLACTGSFDDRISADDALIAPDGLRDVAFHVRIRGTFVALALVSSDLHGRVVGNEVWDTVVGDTPMPSALGLPFKIGRETAGMALYDTTDRLINPRVTLEPRAFDGSLVTIVVPDPWGFLRDGRTFTLLGLRADGKVEKSTAVAL